MKKNIISKFDDYDAFQLKKGTLVLYAYEDDRESEYVDFGIVLDDGVHVAPAKTESIDGVIHKTPYVQHNIYWFRQNEVAYVFKFHCCNRMKIVIYER